MGNLDLKTVDVATGTAKVVENRDGSHHPVGWLDDRTVAYVYESYRDAPGSLREAAQRRNAKRLTYSRPRRVPSRRHFDRLESVTWNSADGVKVHGYLRRPSSGRVRRSLPALVVSHTYNVGQFYNQWSPIFSYMVQSGYVLLR